MQTPSWQPIETPVSRPLWEVFRSAGRAESPTRQLNSSSFLSIAVQDNKWTHRLVMAVPQRSSMQMCRSDGTDQADPAHRHS